MMKFVYRCRNNGGTKQHISLSEWGGGEYDGLILEDRVCGPTEEESGINHKALELDQGFLIYASQTHTSMVPCLKRIHLKLDG
jgi:hypothetical protein